MLRANEHNSTLLTCIKALYIIIVHELKNQLPHLAIYYTCFDRSSAALGVFLRRYVTESQSDSAIFILKKYRSLSLVLKSKSV